MQDPEYQAGLERMGAAADEEAYQEWLDVMRRFRTDPTFFDDVLNREDPMGGGFDANQDYVMYGIHPFYDYGFETQRGRGRVLWDLLRPRLKQEVKNIKALNILWFWREAAARTAMHPSRINFEQERRISLRASGMTKLALPFNLLPVPMLPTRTRSSRAHMHIHLHIFSRSSRSAQRDRLPQATLTCDCARFRFSLAYLPNCIPASPPLRTGSGFSSQPHVGSRQDGLLPAFFLLMSERRLAPWRQQSLPMDVTNVGPHKCGMRRASRPLTRIFSESWSSKYSNSDDGRVGGLMSESAILPFSPSVFWQSQVESPRDPPRGGGDSPASLAFRSSRSQ